MDYRRLPRRPLGFLPTHQTGLALGGNKTRKLEFLLGEALARGCDTLITGGAAQSNHCRQTAAAAAACGLACHLVLGGEPPELPEGNLLLDTLFGAVIHWTGELRKGEKIPEIAEEIRAGGGVPYIIPYGGSSPIGAAAFVEAAGELAGQLAEAGETATHVLFPSSSGGTQAGLAVGKRIFEQPVRLIGVGIDKGEAGEAPFDEHVLELTRETAALLGVEEDFGAGEVEIRNDFVGEGYGVVGELERRAIGLLARTEGILLDPVYTGRAMGALIEMIENHEFSANDTVLFWHTGGTPALFPYAREILAGSTPR
jgi:1-aminocyclopropane-1-carboxylate deaminase/D-cysteine desulfhydrase-like pyridoxal-dependent ACC family enzyme